LLCFRGLVDIRRIAGHRPLLTVHGDPRQGLVRRKEALSVWRPDAVLEKSDVLTEVELPEFDEALPTKVFANLASHGMTLQHLAG
jgi:hypothetical protein